MHDKDDKWLLDSVALLQPQLLSLLCCFSKLEILLGLVILPFSSSHFVFHLAFYFTTTFPLECLKVFSGLQSFALSNDLTIQHNIILCTPSACNTFLTFFQTRTDGFNLSVQHHKISTNNSAWPDHLLTAGQARWVTRSNIVSASASDDIIKCKCITSCITSAI